MRRIVTGVGADGRSTVFADGEPPVTFHSDGTAAPARVDAWSRAPVPTGEAVVHQLWALGAEPRRGIGDPTTAMTGPEFDTPAGETSWIVTQMGPHLDVPMHSTPTVDYGLVLAGRVELGLETGSVSLGPGDTVVVDAVLHSWRTGPEGCVIATVQVGLAAGDRVPPGGQ